MPKFEMVNVPPVYSSGFNLHVSTSSKRTSAGGGLLSVSGSFAEGFDFVADCADTFGLNVADYGGD